MGLAAISGCCHCASPNSQVASPLAIKVTADRPEARYLNGEKAVFTIQVTSEGQLVSRGGLEVWIAQDGGPAGIVIKRFDLATQNPVQVEGTVKEPAFLLCQAWASAGAEQAYGEKMVWYRAPTDTSKVTISLAPDRPEFLYSTGECVTFTASVTQDGKPVSEGWLELTLNREGHGDPVAMQTFDLSEGGPLQISGTLNAPSFLYCKARLTQDSVKDKLVSALCSVGYDVENIVAVTGIPEDFEAFWNETLARARQLPVDVELEEMEELSHTKATYHRFSINTLNDERVYGFLGIPRGSGPFPVGAFYPGAGPGRGQPVDLGLTQLGVITLSMNVHKYPVSESPEEAKQQLADYIAEHNASSYISVGASSRETFHFYTILAGFCRALDYVCAHDGWWDGKRLMISGSSQGGFLTLVMSSLYADKVTSAMAGVPWRCGSGRTHKPGKETILDAMAYYDPVNFARFIRCPIQMSVGFVDGSCPPATVFSAYNALQVKDRKIKMGPREAHGTTPERQAMERECILRGLGLQ